MNQFCLPPSSLRQLFEVRKRKWVSYSAGEELFGLPVTKYPELARTEEEITMLDKLYRCSYSFWEQGGWEKVVGQRA